MELMIHFTYTNKEVLLRELISNTSDVTDKMYCRSLTSQDLTFNRDDYIVEILSDKGKGTLTIKDHSIGIDQEDLVDNLGTITRNGSLDFKKKLEDQGDTAGLIGQFGVRFYSAFLVADKVEVLTKKSGQDQAYLWTSPGVDGFTIEKAREEDLRTSITLHLKKDLEDENYSQLPDTCKIQGIVARYSSYVRYPIQMEVTKSGPIENPGQGDQEPKYGSYQEIETLSSMISIWKKNKKDLTRENYESFYHDEGFSFGKPLDHIHIKVEGLVNYRGILYAPSSEPFNWWSKNFEKGLKLCSNEVLIMGECQQLLPDAFSFVTEVIGSEDLNLNISREILQEDRELRAISKNIERKIKDRLLDLMKNRRKDYVDFYKTFGLTFKTAIYESFDMRKDKYPGLLLFVSFKDQAYTSLDDYLGQMQEDQGAIYYATGDNLNKMNQLPQKEALTEKGLEILYLTNPIDELILEVMTDYKGKAFVSINREKEEKVEKTQEEEGLFKGMKEILGGEVVEIKTSENLTDRPVCLLGRGKVSIEVEEIFQAQDRDTQAEKILEINRNHPIYRKLLSLKDNGDMLRKYTKLLYNQTRLIEGLGLQNPSDYTKTIFDLLTKEDQ